MAKYHVILQQSTTSSTTTTTRTRNEEDGHDDNNNNEDSVRTVTSTSLATGTLRPLLLAAGTDHDNDDDVDHDDDDQDANTKMATAIHAATKEDDNDEKNNSVFQNPAPARIHVIILVHGWLGCPQDLGYLHHAMESQASKIAKEQQQEEEEEEEEGRGRRRGEEPFHVYTCTSNDGNTNDGIVAGSDRIAKEIQDYLRNLQNQYRSGNGPAEITLSIVGYSLGGLYARYALPRILPPPQANNNNNNPQEEIPLPRIVPKIFCTVATPHLGTLGHMWMKFPTVVEKRISQVSTQTGRDLFHHTPHIQNTIFDPQWFEPLLRFEKRIAYANTYGMDLMVPTSTAAFVTETSQSEHFVQPTPTFTSTSASSSAFSTRSVQQQSCSTEDYGDEEDGEEEVVNNNNNNPFVALVVKTPKRHELLFGSSNTSNVEGKDQHDKSDDPLDVIMAKRLDAMGWTKVFVDFTHDGGGGGKRSSTTTKPERSSLSSSFCSSSFMIDSKRNNSNDCMYYTSSALHSEFNKSKKSLFLPVGHDLVVVNSKNVFSSYASRKGRPVVDQLARDLVHDIVTI